MALIALHARERIDRLRLGRIVEGEHDVAVSASWEGFGRLVRERPVTAAVVDLGSLTPGASVVARLLRFRAAFPGLGVVLVVRRTRDPVVLFRLGSTGIQNLVLMDVESVERSLPRAVARALDRGAASLVTRAVSAYLPSRELKAVQAALGGVHHLWSAEGFAQRIGLSRPFLSERFKASGLPSVGHFLLWTRLLHAGYWLTDPGRTAESVSRQLEYSSGAAFRRALKGRTGATPTELVESGGFPVVLRHFLDACSFEGAPSVGEITAA